MSAWRGDGTARRSESARPPVSARFAASTHPQRSAPIWSAAAATCVAILTATLCAGPAAAQTLAQRVEAAPDGWVRFGFEPREGVCGRDGGITMTSWDHPPRWDCEPGPLWTDLRIRDGAVERIETSVGKEPETRSGRVTDLGLVPPAEASAYLLDLAERSPGRVGEDAIFPAFIARGVVAWPRLLEIARTDGIPSDTREAAVFWLGQEASDKAAEGLESVIRDEGELEVRKHAVFALSQHESERAVDALLDLARSSPEPELRKSALFWLGQRADENPRILALFEEILTGG